MVAKQSTPFQELPQGQTTPESGQAESGTQRTETDYKSLPGLRRWTGRSRITWYLVCFGIIWHGPAITASAQADCGNQSGGGREDTWTSSWTRSARPTGDQGSAEEDQHPAATTTANSEEGESNQDEGNTDGYLHPTNEGPYPSRKAEAQGGIGGTPQRYRTSQTGHPKDQEWRQFGKPEPDGHGAGRSARADNSRRGEDTAQRKTTDSRKGQFGHAATAMQPSAADDGVHAELPAAYGTNGGTCGHTAWSLHTRATCEAACHKSGWSNCCCGHGRKEQRNRGYRCKDTRCTTALWDCEKGQDSERTLCTASAGAKGRWGDICIPTPEQNGSVETPQLQRRLRQGMNDRPTWLVQMASLWTMLATLWIGLVLSPMKWYHHGQGEVQVKEVTMQEVNIEIRAERKVRGHTIGRWKLTTSLYMLFFLLAWTGCAASEDEQTRQWLRQRRMAMTLQTTPAAGLANRWHQMEDAHGLRRPPPRGYYDAAIARPQDDLRQIGHSYGLRIYHAAEPHGIETLIVQYWADIRRDVSPNNQWRLHPMHGAAYTSSYFPTSHRHYLITTDWERHCRPRKRAIAVEITWRHARATEQALARPWMGDDEPTVSFLEEMHLLQACTSTHRCHIHHNGVPAESRWMKFSHGDYVKVEA